MRRRRPTRLRRVRPIPRRMPAPSTVRWANGPSADTFHDCALVGVDVRAVRDAHIGRPSFESCAPRQRRQRLEPTTHQPHAPPVERWTGSIPLTLSVAHEADEIHRRRPRGRRRAHPPRLTRRSDAAPGCAGSPGGDNAERRGRIDRRIRPWRERSAGRCRAPAPAAPVREGKTDRALACAPRAPSRLRDQGPRESTPSRR